MAKYKNLIIDQGSDYEYKFTVEPTMDLTDYIVASYFKKHPESVLEYQFDATISNPEIGEITLELAAQDSTSIPHGRYFFDVEVHSIDNKTKRVLEGMLVLTPEITRVVVE